MKREWHEMRIVNGRPPNFSDIVDVFPGALNAGVMFCYGDTIFAPGVSHVPRQLVEHEFVHSTRQALVGVKNWWGSYLSDPLYRLAEELPAHIAEYETVMATKHNPKVRSIMLNQIAERLSGPLYGNIWPFESARNLIRDGAKRLRNERK